MTTNQFEQLAGIIEGWKIVVEKMEDRPGVDQARPLLAQAEDLYWEAAEAERLRGIMEA